MKKSISSYMTIGKKRSKDTISLFFKCVRIYKEEKIQKKLGGVIASLHHFKSYYMSYALQKALR